MDGTDGCIMMGAEEYLQPDLITGSTTTSSSSTNGTMKHNNGYPSQDASWPDSPHNFHNRYQARQRYGGERFQSTIDSRYCSDPLNTLGKDTSDGCYSEGSIKSKQAQVGNLRLDLPVDDDDYLMPSPQNNKSSTAYLDVVSDPNAKNPGELI